MLNRQSIRKKKTKAGIKTAIVSLVLRQAYVDLLQREVTLDYPTDCFGDRCFSFLMELPKNNPYFMGISAHSSKDGTICLWDVPLNGEALHPLVSPVRADMLISLPESQPVTDSEKLVCSELLELGLARKEGERILPAFPCLNAQQSEILNNRLIPVTQDICDSAKSRIDGISRIMTEHAPGYLADYAGKLSALLLLKEAETLMRLLCESSWLLPMKDCLATTVILGNK